MDILENPFFTLGVTTRDDRRQIMSMAEEKSLFSDEEIGSEASSTLTNPRKRLAAEVGWLPGVGPRRATEALALIQSNPKLILDLINIPPLARANLLAAALVRAVEDISIDAVSSWIVELAKVHDEIDVESTMILINEERAVAGFPAVTNSDVLKMELHQERRQYYRAAIKDALNSLSSAGLVKAITNAVETVTDIGETHAPVLIDDLVDSFEVEAQRFFEQETKIIDSLITQIKKSAVHEQNETTLNGLVTKLERVVKNWDLVAQPIQVSARSRGMDHALSHKMAGEIRGLAVELFNKHDHLEISRRMTTLVQEVFAEVDRVVDQSIEDSVALDEIVEQRAKVLQKAKEESERWRQEITYEAELGLVFKENLRISPDGVELKGKRFPLESISRLRWGGTQHSVNGIPTGTIYFFMVGTGRDGEGIKLNKKQVYSKFIDRLWKAVGTRLLTEMLEELRDGKRRRFGNAIVDDYGVEMERTHFFSANERVHCRWADLVIYNANGCFCIEKKGEEKVSVHLSYQEEDNVHILETAMTVFWKRSGSKISNLLTQEG